MKDILITSPAGSGNTFAVDLIRSNFFVEVNSIGHDLEIFESGAPQMAIIRNPYESVASGTERWIDTAGHKPFEGNPDVVPITDIDGVKRAMGWEQKRYIDLLKNIESFDNVKFVSFELLTENQSAFLEEVRKFFEIESDSVYSSAQQSIQNILDSDNANRVPREESEARKVIDELLAETYPKETWEAWKIYLDLKSKLNEAGL